MSAARIDASRRRHRSILALLAALLAAAVGYVGGYVAYRQSHVERWAKDGKPYVIFDSMGAYYAFRPLSRLDEALTGTGAHIGPHR